MKILFLDPLGSYGARTCADEPLGGTQSAVTYLALALARAGVGVMVANRRADDVLEERIAWRNLARMQQRFAATLHDEGVTHLVVVSSANLSALRPRIAWNGPWILWNHHWTDQPSLAALGDPAVRDGWDAVVSVSATHHAGMERAFQLRPERHWIMRNALGPHFARLFADWDEFRLQREHRATTRFVYTSTPFRGLDVLAAAWGDLGARRHWSCTVVSGMQPLRTRRYRLRVAVRDRRGDARHEATAADGPGGARPRARGTRFLGLSLHVHRDVVHLGPRRPSLPGCIR